MNAHFLETLELEGSFFFGGGGLDEKAISEGET